MGNITQGYMTQPEISVELISHHLELVFGAHQKYLVVAFGWLVLRASARVLVLHFR